MGVILAFSDGANALALVTRRAVEKIESFIVYYFLFGLYFEVIDVILLLDVCAWCVYYEVLVPVFHVKLFPRSMLVEVACRRTDGEIPRR